MTNPSIIGDRSQVAALQQLSNQFHLFHYGFIPQDIAERNRQNIAAAKRQDVAMDCRRILRTNLAALLDAHGQTPATLRASYLAGPKKGKRVSERTVRYMLAVPAHGESGPPSQSLDTLAAVADALGKTPVHLLLLPGLDPTRPTIIWSEKAVLEAQAIARAYGKLIQMHGEEPRHDAEPTPPPSIGGAQDGLTRHRKVPSEGAHPRRRKTGN